MRRVMGGIPAVAGMARAPRIPSAAVHGRPGPRGAFPARSQRRPCPISPNPVRFLDSGPPVLLS